MLPGCVKPENEQPLGPIWLPRVLEFPAGQCPPAAPDTGQENSDMAVYIITVIRDQGVIVDKWPPGRVPQFYWEGKRIN